ncbi:MAG: hypothetical protein GYA18_05135 [Chloroflexi bacterium]|nr:hypothetical protein [Chloroflexota bacterium]
MISKRDIIIFLSLFFLTNVAACRNVIIDDDPVLTISVEELVAQTLQAFQLETTLSPAAGQADAQPNEYSIEVTQEVQVDETPDEVSETGDIPVEHYIYNIWGHRQYFAIGCEASAATDWAKYFGVEINEFNFQYQLPQSDNPDLGFVGSVDGPWGQVPPYAYGVHAAPVAAVLQQYYGIPAVGMKGFSLEQLKREIAADRPVITWVVGNVVGGIPYEYTDSQGNTTVVAAYEHVVIVTGYSEEHIRYMNNGKFYEIPTEYFLNSWGILGNMVIYRAAD